MKSATDSAISCSIIRPAPANAIRLCCPASRSKATTTTVAIARPWATAHLRTCQGAGEKIYYNAEGMCRLKQSNGEDSTTRSSGSLPCLNSTPGLAALKASQFCRLPTVLTLYNSLTWHSNICKNNRCGASSWRRFKGLRRFFSRFERLNLLFLGFLS